jgi:NAD(P)-dependent dehydrogenase (short-subunit alcohol dehydrogenase family)
MTFKKMDKVNWDAVIPKEVLDNKILPQIPVGRLGKPEEVAGLII